MILGKTGAVCEGMGLMSGGIVCCCNCSPAGDVVRPCILASAAFRLAARADMPDGGWVGGGVIGSVVSVGGGVLPLSLSQRSSGSTYFPLIQGIGSPLSELARRGIG